MTRVQTKSLILLLLAFLIFSSCSERNSTFFEAVGNKSPDDVTRLYIDAFGNLYPNSGLKSDFQMKAQHGGNLLDAMRDTSSQLCEDVANDSETEILCKSIPLLNWYGAQSDLWKRTAESIVGKSNATAGNVDIIFLIHGFNNLASDSENSFKSVRNMLDRYKSSNRRQYFVEIYWDGFKYSFDPRDAWGKAQATGPLVGFKLRRLMHKIKQALGNSEAKSVRIRFLTHSSGAIIIGSLFGDPIAALPLLQNPPDKEGDYGYFAVHRNSLDPKNENAISSFSDLRIGMLAPATSDWTFIGNNKHAGGFLSSGATVLFSIQPDDEALTKGGLGGDFPNLGSTGLGINKQKHYCNNLKDSPDLTSRNIRFLGYDFSRTEAEFPGEVKRHDFLIYMRQAANQSSFMDDLFGDGPIYQREKERRLCSD